MTVGLAVPRRENVSPRTRILFLGAAVAPHVTRWVSFLRDEGHDVLLASLHPGRDPQPGVVPLRRTPSGQVPPWDVPGALRRLSRVVDEFQPDLTIAYALSSYGLLAGLARLEPWVGVAAGGDILVDPWDTAWQRLTHRLAARLAIRRAERLVVWAPHLAERLWNLGCSPKRILVQPRGVSGALFPFRGPRRRVAADPLRIVSTRWLKPLYRVETLIEALGLLADRGIGFEARIAGNGPEAPRLERRVRELGLDALVRFEGRLAHDDMAALLAWGDVYVSTSCTDGASSSLFEALSVGLYPLASDIPANRFVLTPGVDADLFPVGNPDALTELLARAAREPSLVDERVAAGRDVVAARLDYGHNMRRIGTFLLDAVRPAREGRTRVATVDA